MPARAFSVAAFFSVLLLLITNGFGAAAVTFGLPADSELSWANAKLALPQGELPNADDVAGGIKRLVEVYPPVDFDPALIGEQLGTVESCFQFVRDQIRFESYPGVFRGANGTYAARAGNADDRALLLAAMLKANGIESRFAVGRLAPADVEKLVSHMFDPAVPREAANAPQPANLDFVNRMRMRALRDYSVVLGAMGAKLPTATGVSHQQLAEEISDHVWVQAKVAGKWVDLDTSFPDATSGKAFCTANQTPDTLPAARFQRVTIRVIAEQLDGGSLKPATVLEVSRPVVDLIDKQIFLIHSKEGGMGQAIAGISGGWMPILWMSGDVETGKAIHFDAVNTEGKAPPRKGLGAALDALGDAPAPSAASPDFVAEYLEFQISLPGGHEQTVRRTLCDRAGAAWRLTQPLDPKTLHPLKQNASGPIAAGTLHNILFSSGRHDMASYSQAIAPLHDSMQPSPADAKGSPAADPDFGQQIWPLAMQNLSTVLWADQVFLPALNDDPHVRCYLDSPRIVLFSLNAQPADGAPDQLNIDSEVDLRRDSIRAVASSSADEGKAVRRKIWFGLLDGALEHEISAQSAFALGGDGSQASSTSALVGAAGAKLLQPGDSSGSWEKLAAVRDTAAGLSSALGTGDSVVVADDVVRGGPSGWWDISTTGDTRAVLEEDLNGGKFGGRFGSSGNYIPRGTSGGNSGTGGVYRVYPDGTSRPLNPMGPQSTKKGGGSEYTTILANVSVPGAVAVKSVITPRIIIAAVAAAAALAYYDFH